MKYLIYSIAFLFSNSLMAQTAYETMDSLSSEIRNLQFSANGLKGLDKDGNFEVSFPEDNFNFLISTRHANHVVYKKTGDQEVLTNTEEIDLSKALSVETEWMNDDLGVVKLSFPRGYLKPNAYMDGNPINANAIDYLPFYFKRMNSQNNDRRMMNLVVEICHRTKIDKGSFTEEEVTEMNKQVVWLRENYSFDNISSFNQFLEKYPSSLYFNEVQKNQEALTEIRNKEIQRAQETKEGIINIQELFSFGKKSYLNYAYFEQADSIANNLLENYSFSDFSAGKYTELKNLRPELQERYKWNKAYFEKRDKILAYDALLINASNLNNNYMNKLNATVNETLYLKATLLVLGGMATLMGGYAVIANDNTFTQSERNSLLKYGGASLGIGLIWSILQGSSVKKAGRNASAVQKRADEMKTSIGPVLNKRKESLNGSPLININ